MESSAVRLYYSAMVDTKEAEQPQFASLVTGHFVQDVSYRTWRTHGTKDYLLIYTDAGHGRFGFAGGEIITSAGDFVLLAPGTPHDYGTANHGRHGTHWKLLWAHFQPRPHWHALLRWPAASPGLMPLPFSDPLLHRNAEQCLRETHRLATGAGRSREAFAMNALEQTLLWCDAACPRPPPLDPRVQAAMDFLCAHLGTAVSIEQVARAAGLSASRLAHLFKAQAGVTLGQFVEARRLERARQLLARTGLSVEAVAADVGYDNPFYFSLRFKKATGQAPTEFRRAHQEYTESRLP